MRRAVLDTLTTNHYKALKIMFDRRSVVHDGRRMVSITQREIGDALKVSKPTVIAIMKALGENGLVIPDTVTKGRYYITDVGERIVRSFEENFEQSSDGGAHG